MMNILSVTCIVILVITCVHAQLGSVHCKVGCACSNEFKPLCGNDHVTYHNECKLRCAQCDKNGLQALFNGRCEEGGVYAFPPPFVTYTAPLPAIHFGPAPVYYPVVGYPPL